MHPKTIILNHVCSSSDDYVTLTIIILDGHFFLLTPWIYIYIYIYIRIHEENTKENHNRVVSFLCDKDACDLNFFGLQKKKFQTFFAN